jgi:hypothetical protein
MEDFRKLQEAFLKNEQDLQPVPIQENKDNISVVSEEMIPLFSIRVAIDPNSDPIMAYNMSANRTPIYDKNTGVPIVDFFTKNYPTLSLLYLANSDDRKLIDQYLEQAMTMTNEEVDQDETPEVEEDPEKFDAEEEDQTDVETSEIKAEGYTKEEVYKLCHSRDHDCATIIEHSEFGLGKPLHGRHAIPDEKGFVEWYDVRFKHGVEEKIYTKDVKILASESHMKKDEELITDEEHSEHEIVVGDYTTKFFHMCGGAQKVMSANKDIPGADVLAQLQDEFYELEKNVMLVGQASEQDKLNAQTLYNQIMTKAGEIGLADEIDDYMKMHLDSILIGDPKPGFGRTDTEEEVSEDYIENPEEHDHTDVTVTKLKGYAEEEAYQDHPKSDDDDERSVEVEPNETEETPIAEEEIDEGKMKELHMLVSKGVKDPKKIAKELGLKSSKDTFDAITSLIKGMDEDVTEAKGGKRIANKKMKIKNVTDLKHFIVRNYSITGKPKNDPDELSTSDEIMQAPSWNAVKGILQKNMFDKNEMNRLYDELINYQLESARDFLQIVEED